MVDYNGICVLIAQSSRAPAIEIWVIRLGMTGLQMRTVRIVTDVERSVNKNYSYLNCGRKKTTDVPWFVGAGAALSGRSSFS
jgi:hypothetical protein